MPKCHFRGHPICGVYPPCGRGRPQPARWRERAPLPGRPGRGPWSGTRPSRRRSRQTAGTGQACCPPCSIPPVCNRRRLELMVFFFHYFLLLFPGRKNFTLDVQELSSNSAIWHCFLRLKWKSHKINIIGEPTN
jgi:hypothetical protein